MTMFPDMMAQKGLILKEWLFVGGTGNISGDDGPEYVWTKPPGANFLYFFIQNGGSAGGTGFTRASGVNGGGGSGGGGGGSAWFITPSIFLPNQLLIRPSRGGIGGGSKAPTNGRITLLSQPSSTVLFTALSTGTFGGDGSGAAGGTGGAGNNVSTQLTGSPFFFNSIFQSCPSGLGLAGGNGGFNVTAAQNGTIGNNLFGAGGGGGGGVNTSDASTVAGNGGVPRASGANTDFFNTPLAPTSGSSGEPGEHGTTYWGQTMFPMGATGGAGARAGGTVAGGRGGGGGWGCGGGGGGAGTTGGAGGNGGPGFVYILAW